ncbi:MAG: endonuclease III domain-containing protein [Candidatus Omnitrophica bacterium]|nr:endonuclease III domain-containing protein [Candidatus Omnitrophota bacterium]
MGRGPYGIYRRLFACFGPQHWWPAETPFEVIVGAILTQNTSWRNVEQAIRRLKKERLLNPGALRRLPVRRLAALIRPAGYYNLKARRLKAFLEFLFDAYAGNLARMGRKEAGELRRELLRVKGIGPETADSILLYAFNKPAFVIDAYTRRVCARHNLAPEARDYESLRAFFISKLKADARLFNEYHALLVKLAKDFCRKNEPRCGSCPLGG